MARSIFCRRCGHEQAVVADHFPPLCASCLSPGRWTTLAPAYSVEPVTRWHLSALDIRMLRALRIAADVET